ncbi:MAG: hypothetical protein M1829_002247 [Trizodia sp. TS-e1964]|nr:MAG: hypothetical protein M1829_002247 [Trizodia sp. TS-e1964]
MVELSIFALWLFTTGLVGFPLFANSQDLDPIVNFCSRSDHQTVIKDNVLYIDGGNEIFQSVPQNGTQYGVMTAGVNNYLIAIDLSQSWDWKTNISEVALPKDANPRTGTKPPFVIRGALYQGNPKDTRIWLYGGTTSWINQSFPNFDEPSTSQYSLWSFDPKSKEWDQFDVSLGANLRPNSGAYAEAPDQSLAFYLNGNIDNGSSISTTGLKGNTYQPLSGMIVLDTGNQTARNLSTQAFSGDEPRSRGQMEYLPAVGSKGALVYLGGGASPKGSVVNSPLYSNLVEMDQIDIFDIASLYNGSSSGTWLKQAATGDIPQPRIDFCLVSASAPDNSTHNLYIYGGRNSNTYFDDIYVLSLPTFTWTKVFEGQTPRYGHTCRLAAKRLMLTVGGLAPPPAQCDWEIRSVSVFDTATVTWGSVFNASAAPYDVPQIVAQRIGKNRSPSLGWSSPQVQVMFNPLPTLNSTLSSSPIPSPPIPSQENIPNPPSGRNVAAIAGAVVGALAGLILILGAVLFVLYHKKKARERDMEGPSPELTASLGIGSSGRYPHITSELAGPDYHGELGSGAEIAAEVETYGAGGKEWGTRYTEMPADRGAEMPHDPVAGEEERAAGEEEKAEGEEDKVRAF